MSPKRVSVFTKAKEYENEGFEVFGNVMRCKFCDVRVDYEKKDSSAKHIKSQKHIAAKQRSNQALSQKRQLSIEDSAKKAKELKDEKEEFILDTVEAFIGVNICMSKLDDKGI